jgi:hypothetical protein
MNTLISLAPLIGFFVAMFFIALGLLWLSYKSGAKRYLTPLLPLISGEVKVPVFGEASLEGSWDGRGIKVVYGRRGSSEGIVVRGGGGRNVERIAVHFSCALPVVATISPKGFFDKIKNEFREPFTTGDVDFDNKYTVSTKDYTKTKFFLDQKRREAVERIFNLISTGREKMPSLESVTDRKALKKLEGNETVLKLEPGQIILTHCSTKVPLPPSFAIATIVEGILKAMRALTES